MRLLDHLFGPEHAEREHAASCCAILVAARLMLACSGAATTSSYVLYKTAAHNVLYKLQST